MLRRRREEGRASNRQVLLHSRLRGEPFQHGQKYSLSEASLSLTTKETTSLAPPKAPSLSTIFAFVQVLIQITALR